MINVGFATVDTEPNRIAEIITETYPKKIWFLDIQLLNKLLTNKFFEIFTSISDGNLSYS